MILGPLVRLITTWTTAATLAKLLKEQLLSAKLVTSSLIQLIRAAESLQNARPKFSTLWTPLIAAFSLAILSKHA